VVVVLIVFVIVGEEKGEEAERKEPPVTVGHVHIRQKIEGKRRGGETRSDERQMPVLIFETFDQSGCPIGLTSW
jgi:hypothetical protein